MKRTMIGVMVALAITHAMASPSNEDLDIYRVRLQVYLTMKQSPEQICVSLGNYFGRQGNFQSRNNRDGTVDIIYVEGADNMIRYMATIAKIKPVYEVVPSI